MITDNIVTYRRFWAKTKESVQHKLNFKNGKEQQQNDAPKTTTKKTTRLLTVTVDKVPLAFHEVAIISGYRLPQCSPKDCIRSSMSINNETFNFWSHFIPFWYVRLLFIY
jgi:hypothetical protein